MPTADERRQLRRAAEELKVPLSDGQVTSLLAYVDLLEKANRIHNLTAARERDSLLALHVLDCLAVATPLRRRTGGSPARLLDVGSGAGLPGVILAIAMPELAVTCVDAVGKKAAFVAHVGRELGMPLVAVHGRVEELDGVFDVVACRAFVSLAGLVRLTADRLGTGGIWLAMKGQVPATEIAALQPAIEVLHVEPVHVPSLGAERCIVWMQRTGDVCSKSERRQP